MRTPGERSRERSRIDGGQNEDKPRGPIQGVRRSSASLKEKLGARRGEAERKGMNSDWGKDVKNCVGMLELGKEGKKGRSSHARERENAKGDVLGFRKEE